MTMNDIVTTPAPRAPQTADEVRLIGAEMRYGSDPAGAMAKLAEPFLRDVLRRPGRVLFAGVHDADVVARIRAAHDVTVQLRRVADAATAKADARLRDVSVLCGSIERVDGAYDLVVALGGLDRLGSPDDVGAGDALTALTQRVAPGGVLVLASENGFGLRRVVEVSGPEPADGATIGHDAMLRGLNDAGFAVATDLAAYPDLHDPSLLMHRGLLEAPEHRDAAAQLVAAAAGNRPRSIQVSDPRVLARAAVRNGLGHALAAGWVVIAYRPDGVAPLVPTLAAYGGAGTSPVITDGRQAGPATPSDPSLGWRPEWSVPDGPLLIERIADACAAEDLPTVRELLARYATWLGLDQAEGDAAPVRLATPSEMVDDGTQLSPIGPVSDASAPARVAFAAGLLDIADCLQSAGLAHPWSPTLTPERLAIRLGSMAGRVVTDAEIEAARALAVPPPTGADDALDEEAPVGPAGELARPSGYAEAVRLATEISRELAEARAQLRFLSETIADRDLTLRQQSTLRRLMRIARRPVSTVRAHNRFGSRP
jgi:hypothetical protein